MLNKSSFFFFPSGPFLDLLFEKVELMPTNSFSTNLLVTGILSQLASYPQALMRSVLTHPDIVMQPSIRSLFTAIASLRQKLDIIMPTFPNSEEAIHAVRKILSERVVPAMPPGGGANSRQRRDSNVSIMTSAISQIGELRAGNSALFICFSEFFVIP